MADHSKTLKIYAQKFFYVLLDTLGRSGPRRDSQGDPPHHAHPGGRPVTDNMDTVGDVLLWDAGSGKTNWSGWYIMTEK